jgi:hypothetical protein
VYTQPTPSTSFPPRYEEKLSNGFVRVGSDDREIVERGFGTLALVIPVAVTSVLLGEFDYPIKRDGR